MKQSVFVPEFVEAVPEDLEPGHLYISERFRTASHLCACGCGSRVVTPLKPAKWQLTKRGDRVSLSPSIGRWQLPCKSHYWICDNRVVWSRAFSDEEMQAVLERDARDLHEYHAARRRPRWIPAFVHHLWRKLFGNYGGRRR